MPYHKILSNLDLTDPADFLTAIYHSEIWPTGEFPNAERWDRDMPIVQGFLPAILGYADSADAVPPIRDLIYALGGKSPEYSGEPVNPAPIRREWLSVFREAFRRDLIGPIAFGAVYVHLTCGGRGNGNPELPAFGMLAKRQSLADAVASHPMGLMDQIERDELEALPDTIVLYRGGRCPSGASAIENARGLHWALYESHATYFMHSRHYSRHRALMATDCLRMFDRSIGAARRDRLVTDYLSGMGEPFLLKAMVPKSAIIANLKSWPTPDEREFIVDFEAIDESMVTDITPRAAMAA